MALDSLADLRRLDRHLDRRLEALLRVSLAAYRAAGTRHRVIPDPGIAVQTACAHLAVGERENAYLALRDAQDALPRPGSGRP